MNQQVSVHVNLSQHGTSELPATLNVTREFVENKCLRFSFHKIVQLLIEINLFSNMGLDLFVIVCS